MKPSTRQHSGSALPWRMVAAGAAVTLVALAGGAMLLDRSTPRSMEPLGGAPAASATGEVDQSALSLQPAFDDGSPESGASIAAYGAP